MSRFYSEAYKWSLYEKYRSGFSLTELCEISGITDKPLREWFRYFDRLYSRTSSISLFVCRIFQDAFYSRGKPEGVLFHSDQGGQYRSCDFQNLLTGHKVRQSFSEPGVPFDNAPMESFFASLKVEEIYRIHYAGISDLTASLRNYISFYNNKRPHTSIGGKTPVEAKNEYFQKLSAVETTSCAF